MRSRDLLAAATALASLLGADLARASGGPESCKINAPTAQCTTKTSADTIPPPKATDTCPVCGMAPAKFTEWVAVVGFRDGTAQYFDGPKDLFRFLHDLPRYCRGRPASDITSTSVTDYYHTRRMDARQAFYVLGSDVFGPMGSDLVPLATRAEADDFMKEHKGARILTFAEVTPEVIKALDAARK